MELKMELGLDLDMWEMTSEFGFEWKLIFENRVEQKTGESLFVMGAFLRQSFWKVPL